MSSLEKVRPCMKPRFFSQKMLQKLHCNAICQRRNQIIPMVWIINFMKACGKPVCKSTDNMWRQFGMCNDADTVYMT